MASDGGDWSASLSASFPDDEGLGGESAGFGLFDVVEQNCLELDPEMFNNKFPVELEGGGDFGSLTLRISAHVH